MKNVGIVGKGAVGMHLMKRLEHDGHHVAFMYGRADAGISFNKLVGSGTCDDAVFLTISTKDKGEAARDYILACVEVGIPVITCEKGALAYHFDVLKPHMEMIGYSACVGGGTQMLRYLERRHFHRSSVDIQAVINGTLNFVFDELSRGRSVDEACREACRLGYAEPGATDPLSLINGELQDVVLKTCVMLNVGIGVETAMPPQNLASNVLADEHLDMLEVEGGNLRFQVSFSNVRDTSVGYALTVFGVHYGTWKITGGFKRITPDQNWLPGGVGNAIHISEGKLGAGGKYTLSGPGAGLEPTTSAMLADFAELCK